MMRRHVALLSSLFALVAGPSSTSAQEASPSLSPDGPRFLLATSSSMVPVDAQRAPVLRQRVSLDVVDGSIEAAFAELTRQTGVHFVYSTDVVPADKRVRVRVHDVTLAAALSALLTGDMDVVVSEGGGTLIVRPGERRRAARPKRTAPGIIQGYVREQGSGTPIVHVDVSVEGGGRALTNESGFYRITKVPPGRHRVTASSIGYAKSTQEVEVGDSATVRLDFALEIVPTRLAEIVTTVTGQRRRLEIGNDITVLNVDSIVKNEPITSVTDLLEGRVPGLVVQRTSGAPGDPARIRIRGVSSPRQSNDPIIVVDGVRVYSEHSDERAGNLAGGNYAAPSPLDYIDPHTIEKIEVIKGPSAASLYGQDAANGVIAITTKRGQLGPTRWSVSAEHGVTTIAQEYPELHFRWGHLVAENTPVHCPINNRVGGASDGLACQADSVRTFQMLNDPELTVLDRGRTTNVSIGASGGSSTLMYNVTASYLDQVGLIALPAYEATRYREDFGRSPPDWMRRPQNHKRWGVSTRTTMRLGTSADVSLSASLSRTEQQRSSLERELGNLMATYFDRNTGKYYALRTNTGKVEEITGSALTHYHQRATATATELRNALGLNWRPFPWLSTSAQAGLNVIQRRDEIFEPRGAPNPTHGQLLTGSLASARGAAVVTSLNLLASVQKSLGGGFGLGIASGVNYTGRSIDDLDVAGRDLPEGTEALNRAATIYRVHDRQVGWATYGWYIEPTLNYHQRLRISPGIRLDGGSTFGTRLKLPSFPKVGVSYLISDEGFFPSALRSWVNSLRLRAAYGHAGRQPGPTDRLRLYGPKVTELIDRRPVDAVFLETLGNATLKPERSKEFEGGLDADVFDDRISLSVTGFRKTTVDALIDVPVAPSVYGAYVTQLRNIGVVRNTGLEMTIDIEPVRTDLLRWNAQVSMSRRRDVVVELGRGVEPFYVDGTVRVAPGYPLFSKWARPILGYADLDGDGVIEPREVLLGDTAVYVGSTLPNFTADLHTSLTFLRGALAVSASLHYEDGATQLNDVAYRLSHFGRSWNDPGAGAVALQPALLNETFSRYQTVNVLRVRSISVRYQAPTVVARRLGAQSVSVSLQGTNLGLWTNYRGVDPSVNAAATGNDLVDTGVLPMPRTWQLRVVATY